MSLIVAENTEAGPRIASDTRVIFPNAERPSHQTGTLKAIALASDVAVCFAGDVAAGLEAVRSCATALQGGMSPTNLGDHVVPWTSSRWSDVEFIVAVGGVKPAIARVTAGHIEADLHVAWIGDQAAFESFQRHQNRWGEQWLPVMQHIPNPDGRWRACRTLLAR